MLIPASDHLMSMGGKQHFEFMGPIVGPVGIMLGTPLVNFLLVYGCSAAGCLTWRSAPNMHRLFSSSQLASVEGFAALLGWLILHILLHILLPGRRAKGAKLADGTQLSYKLSGG